MSRRQILSSSGTLAGAFLVPSRAQATARAPDVAVVEPGDVRYLDLARGFNQRWVGNPDHVYLPATTEQVVTAVTEAVRSGRRVCARSGGHCFEDFVAAPDVKAVVDLSLMNQISYDADRRAIEVQAGASLEDTYRTLFRRWGVTVPGGQCLTVGAGGHFPGGGYGSLSRLHGLCVDHLYGVEVVVVDARGKARAVVATRDDRSGDRRDLWWAHTGGGGGNFGIVTRFWFRTPGANGTDPSGLLPRPPSQALVSSVIWPWPALDEAGFTRLVRNYGTWLERNSTAVSPYAGLFSRFNLLHKEAGGVVQLATTMAADGGQADKLLKDHVAAVGDGVDAPPMVLEQRRLPWLHTVSWDGFAGDDPTGRADYKAAHMRRGFTTEQIAALYKHLTRTDYHPSVAVVSIASVGGKIGAVPPDRTAVAQRDSIMKPLYFARWHDAGDDGRHIRWLRELYRDVHAATGGVPVPGEVTDGCFINYPDIDLNDPAWNTSGVPWYTLYYKDNYARLQRAKARWDPRNVFRHSQSIRPPVT